MDWKAQAKRRLLACVLLGALTLAAYLPSLRNGFVSYDDPDYVTENPRVLRGLSWDNVAWAFEGGHAGNWHPLTWLSHMLDVEWFGRNPAGHHATSLGIHAATALLLLLVLARLTGAFWRSGFVAALFALHPLHVESVAWVAERKDVLSGLFFVLTLWAYGEYARKGRAASELEGGTGRGRGVRWGWYILALAFFALGLMSKPMLVTLPCVLLLLDFWPLKRVSLERRPFPLPVLFDKAAFFAFSLGSSLLTFSAQKQGGAVASLEALPLEFRISNALISYVRYLGKTFWPADLAVIYPLPTPKEWPGVWVLGAAVLLGGITALALWQIRKRPYLAVGWFWYLGTLVPVIGLVQVGQQAMADRYTYLPLIGIFIMISWAAAELAGRWLETQPASTAKSAEAASSPRTGAGAAGLGVLAALVLAALAVVSWKQVHYWEDSTTLFARAVASTSRNAIAHNNLGSSLLDAGKVAEAEAQFERALAVRPNYPEALVNLGLCRARQGRTPEAVELMRRAMEIRPTPSGHYNLANFASEAGQFDEAEKHYLAALELKPEFVEARYNLGILRAKQGRTDEAIRDYEAALALRPEYAEARLSLGALLAGQKKFDEAIAQFEVVVRARPDNADARFNLAAALEARGDWAAAAAEYDAASRLKPDDLEARFKLGVARLNQREPAAAAAVFADLLSGLESRAANSNALAQVHHYLAVSLHAQGRLEDALPHYRQAVGLSPNSPIYLNDLAWLLATHPDAAVRNGPEAVALAQKAVELTRGMQAAFLGTLGAAYAEVGQFSEAIAAAGKARDLARAAGQMEIAETNTQLLELYRARKPYRQQP
jgi:tetratricopeptide (TPR) repeat protein